VRALELLAFQPSSAMEVAATMGLHPRTARRVLRTLQAEGYVEQRRDVRSHRYVYSLTPRLLTLAGQLAARVPAVIGGQQAVRQLHRCTGLCACLVMPSYGDVIVLASAGPGAPLPWSAMPATDSAGGRVLLAYYELRDNLLPWARTLSRNVTVRPSAHSCSSIAPVARRGTTASLPCMGLPVLHLA
jgi:DNA-binding IclR family transcriptional regulator